MPEPLIQVADPVFMTFTQTCAEAPKAIVGYALWAIQSEWNVGRFAATGAGPPMNSR